jgi:hypothetical protein
MPGSPSPTDQEATMPQSSPRPGTVRWLSSQGHPGYGPDYAATIWARVQRSLMADGHRNPARAFNALTVQAQSGLVWSAISRERMGWAS